MFDFNKYIFFSFMILKSIFEHQKKLKLNIIIAKIINYGQNK